MASKKVKAIIEASKTGFGIYVENEDLPLTSYGDSIDAAKKDLHIVLKDMIESYPSEQLPKAYNAGNIEFVYQYDVESIFSHFGVFDVTALAKRIGVNPSLMRQYKKGLTTAGPKQRKKIQDGLHQLGKELLAVKL